MKVQRNSNRNRISTKFSTEKKCSTQITIYEIMKKFRTEMYFPNYLNFRNEIALGLVERQF